MLIARPESPQNNVPHPDMSHPVINITLTQRQARQTMSSESYTQRPLPQLGYCSHNTASSNHVQLSRILELPLRLFNPRTLPIHSCDSTPRPLPRLFFEPSRNRGGVCGFMIPWGHAGRLVELGLIGRHVFAILFSKHRSRGLGRYLSKRQLVQSGRHYWSTSK